VALVDGVAPRAMRHTVPKAHFVFGADARKPMAWRAERRHPPAFRLIYD